MVEVSEPARDLTSVGRTGAVGVVERATEVLMFFAATGGEWSASQIATECGISRPSAHRILNTLVQSGYLTRLDSAQFALGPASLDLGRAYLDRLNVELLVGHELRDLAQSTGETAVLSSRRFDARVDVYSVHPDRTFIYETRLNVRVPLNDGASSLVLLATMPEGESGRYEHTVSEGLSPAERIVLDQELERIRNQGYAVSGVAPSDLVTAVAAPIADISGGIVFALSVCGPRERLHDRWADLVPPVVEAAARLSARLLGPEPVVAGRTVDISGATR